MKGEREGGEAEAEKEKMEGSHNNLRTQYLTTDHQPWAGLGGGRKRITNPSLVHCTGTGKAILNLFQMYYRTEQERNVLKWELGFSLRKEHTVWSGAQQEETLGHLLELEVWA